MPRSSPQPATSLNLFEPPPDHPPGLAYTPDLITPAEEQALLGQLLDLPFQPFNFQGHLANRQVLSFGYRYDYSDRRLHDAAPIPDFLLRLREQVARFAGRPPDAFVQVLINLYRPGAGIGWHRDKAHFGEVVGVSLGAPCTLRFAASRASVGSGAAPNSRPAPPICWLGRRGMNGSIRSRR